MRVLHLFDAACPLTCATTLALLADLIGWDGEDGDWRHQVAVVHGGQLDKLAVEQAGLGLIICLPTMPGSLWTRSVVLQYYLMAFGPFDVVHVWSPSVMRMMPTDIPIVFSHRPADPLVIPAGELLPGLVSDIPDDPSFECGLDFTRLAAGDRRIQRKAWGVTDDATLVVAALGDPPDAVDALRNLWVTGLAAESGRDVRLLISPKAAALHRAQRVVEALGKRHYLIVDEQASCPWQVLPACDAALALEAPVDRPPPTPTLTTDIHPGAAGGLSMAWAMAAALPIVAERSPLVAPLLDERRALLTDPNRPAEAAWLLRRLCDDAPLRRRLAKAARRHAVEHFDPAAHRLRMRRTYSRAVNPKSIIPDLARRAPFRRSTPL